MMNMMNTAGWGSGLIALTGLHAIASIVFLVGLIFLVTWALKTLTVAQLKTWGITFAVIGLIVCAFTLTVTPMNKIVRYKFSEGDGPMMNNMQHMMNNGMMMDDDDMMMNHMMDDDDMMEMSMGGMTRMLEGKTGDEFDKAFIEGMIPHHQGAIDMANLALASAKHAEIREMATDIITAQQREIDMMNQWLQDWGYTE